MAQINTKFSGTLGCPNCRLGKFQPGLLIIDSTCICTGQYIIKGSMNCKRIDNVLVCTKEHSLKLGNTATCHCNGKTYKATPFGSRPVFCDCTNPQCRKPHKGKSTSFCVCKKK